MNAWRSLWLQITRRNCRRFSQVLYTQASAVRWQTKGFLTLTSFTGCGLYLHRLLGQEAVFAANISDRVIIEEADHLYSTGDDPKHLYKYLKKYKDSDNAEVLWRFARAARDVALNSKEISSDEKKELVYEAFEVSKQALEVDEKNWGSHKWFAILLGDVGDYEGTKVKISNAYVIKDHLERALQLNPNDATTAHCIGLWCLAFAELPWYQQKIASILFATPPTSSFEEAIKMFELAEKTEPNFYSVNLMQLGRCYMITGDVKRAMMNLDKAANYPATTDEDRDAVEKAKKLLEELIAKHKK